MAAPRRGRRVSQERLSRKVAKVRREDPSLTPKQAAGKASGILKREDAKKAARSRKRKRS